MKIVINLKKKYSITSNALGYQIIKFIKNNGDERIESFTAGNWIEEKQILEILKQLNNGDALQVHNAIQSAKGKVVGE